MAPYYLPTYPMMTVGEKNCQKMDLLVPIAVRASVSRPSPSSGFSSSISACRAACRGWDVTSDTRHGASEALHLVS